MILIIKCKKMAKDIKSIKYSFSKFYTSNHFINKNDNIHKSKAIKIKKMISN